jgi:DnaJ-domain-containing protein 1
VGIGKRLIDVARANVTDFASAFSSDPDTRERRRLDRDLDRELEDEAEREREAQSVGAKAGRQARRVADKAEEAWERAFEEARRANQGGGGGGVRGRPSERDIEDWHRTLEVPVGADFDTIRRSYRRLVAKYHPDKYASDPDKYAVATQVTRKITSAYNGLKQLQPSRP